MNKSDNKLLKEIAGLFLRLGTIEFGGQH